MNESAEEDQGLLSQPAGSGGVLSINLINTVANKMREEMHAMRSDLEQQFTAMRAELEVKMSGRKGTGHWESGSIETLLEKNIIIEQKMEDIEKDMNDVKDIKEVINNDEKTTGMIKKCKEIIKEGTLNIHMINDIKKLKEDLDKGLLDLSNAIETVRQNTEEAMMETKKNNDIDDVKNKVDEIVSRMNNVNQKVKNHNVHLQSLIKFHEDKIEDKFPRTSPRSCSTKKKTSLKNSSTTC